MPHNAPDVDEGERFDLIVVGLGAMGASVTYQAANLGLRVLGIDRYNPPHGLGSTTAETRMTRLAIGEGSQYLPFVARSHEIWREIEAKTGVQLLHESGGLIVTEQAPVEGQRWHDFVLETDRIAAEAGIDFSVVDDTSDFAVSDRLHGLGDKRVGFEPTAGLVMAEDAVAVQLRLAAKAGATITTGEMVTSVQPGPTDVEIVTDRGIYRADHVVLAAGPWLGDLVRPDEAEPLTVTRQVVYWFEVDDLAAFSTERFPTVIWVGRSNEDYVGIFPIPPGGTPALKVLGEQFLSTTHPDSVDREVSDAEIQEFYEHHLAPKLKGVSSRCIKADVCLYTNTPDDHFLIDSALGSDRVLMMSPCSGHGFKHSAALGEAVAQQIARGRSDLDLSPFLRARLTSNSLDS